MAVLVKKDRIIEAAHDLFYRQGYLATGINQVIEEAQCGTRTGSAIRRGPPHVEEARVEHFLQAVAERTGYQY